MDQTFLAKQRKALLDAFTWLTPEELDNILSAIPADVPDTSARIRMTTLAKYFDSRGLPPTSVLLLALAGRGSKQTAVTCAREAARARFAAASSFRQRDESNPREESSSFSIDDLVARITSLPGLQPIESAHNDSMKTQLSRIESSIQSLIEEHRWIKSTIDTERQLRRYQLEHGPFAEQRLGDTRRSQHRPTSLTAANTQLHSPEQVIRKGVDEADGPLE